MCWMMCLSIGYLPLVVLGAFGMILEAISRNEEVVSLLGITGNAMSFVIVTTCHVTSASSVIVLWLICSVESLQRERNKKEKVIWCTELLTIIHLYVLLVVITRFVNFVSCLTTWLAAKGGGHWFVDWYGALSSQSVCWSCSWPDFGYSKLSASNETRKQQTSCSSWTTAYVHDKASTFLVKTPKHCSCNSQQTLEKTHFSRCEKQRNSKKRQCWSRWSNKPAADHPCESHQSWVNCVGVSKSGLLASGSEDNTVCLWRSQTGELVGIAAHENQVIDCTFSSNTLSLLVATVTKTRLRVSSAATGHVAWSTTAGTAASGGDLAVFYCRFCFSWPVGGRPPQGSDSWLEEHRKRRNFWTLRNSEQLAFGKSDNVALWKGRIVVQCFCWSLSFVLGYFYRNCEMESQSTQLQHLLISLLSPLLFWQNDCCTECSKWRRKIGSHESQQRSFGLPLFTFLSSIGELFSR